MSQKKRLNIQSQNIPAVAAEKNIVAKAKHSDNYSNPGNARLTPKGAGQVRTGKNTKASAAKRRKAS